MHIAHADFVKSATSWTQAPGELLPEFAFIGRSNVGKSSLINMLTQRNALAKASRTPGKTQLINYFRINQSWFFVDLPGYGYAKSKVADRKKWIDRTQEYFLNRPCLLQVFVLVDGSISVQKIDLEFCAALEAEGIKFSIIVTKVDKASQRKIHQHMENFKKALQDRLAVIPQIFLSSSKKSKGREKILSYIETLAADMCG